MTLESRLKQIEDIAKAATPGNWLPHNAYSEEDDCDMFHVECGRIATMQDMNHIATFNPETVLKLIKVIRLATKFIRIDVKCGHITKEHAEKIISEIEELLK